jgi:hypothetical protein
VAKGSVPVRFPDFTRGLWEKKRTMMASESDLL